MVNFALSLVLVVAFGFFALVRIRTLLAYFQQDDYNNQRFLQAVFKVRLFDVRATFLAILVLFVCAPFWGQIWAILILALGLAGIGFFECAYQFKKPLVMTGRAKRLYQFGLLGLLLVSLPLLWRIEWLFVCLQLAPLALIAANQILSPWQQRINDGLVREARAKLADIQPLTIGITGSFGKTTVKHILAELLEQDGPVFYSRGSINTVLGLTRHVRRRLQFAHKFFIAEMGAYGIGSIKRLCEFASPHHGIITSIGAAHTERFGSVEVIAQAKSELAQHVCKAGGKVVMPRALLDYVPFERIYAARPEHFLLVGYDANDDIEVRQWVLKDGAWQVMLRLNVAQNIKDLHLTLPLLGEHNVINLALCVGMVSIVAPPILDQLHFLAPEIEQVPHRLEKKSTHHGPTILDDAYNANEIGFENAVCLAQKMARQKGGRAVVVTPGVAELGLEHDRTHERLGKLVAEKVDHVIVVNSARIPTFVQRLKKSQTSFDEVDNLAQARLRLDGMALTKNDIVLYENDLPDLLEEKRML